MKNLYLQSILSTLILSNIACSVNNTVNPEQIEALAKIGSGSAQLATGAQAQASGVREVSDLHSVFREDLQSKGLGFLFTNSDGKRYLVFQDSNDSDNTNPVIQSTDIGNRLKAVLSVKNNAGRILVGASKEVALFHKSLVDLNSAHFRMSPQIQNDLALRMKSEALARSESAENILLIEESDLTVETSDLSFKCSNLASIDNVTMTTGGSVYMIGLKMKEGHHLNIAAGAADGNASIELLNQTKKSLETTCLGSQSSVLYVGKNIFQEEIYTRAGVYSGFISNPTQIQVRDGEEPKNNPPTAF